MHNSEESDKKMNKAKSFNAQTPIVLSTKLKNELAKRKFLNINDEARSQDLAYRLKKSKLVNGDSVTSSSSPKSEKRRGYPEMFMDVSASATCPGTDNASLMSMNFSHYELLRNLSSSLCNSDDAFSNTTCSACMSSPDNNVKNEHLERYFRSVEIWSKQYRESFPRDGGPSGLNLQEPEK